MVHLLPLKLNPPTTSLLSWALISTYSVYPMVSSTAEVFLLFSVTSFNLPRVAQALKRPLVALSACGLWFGCVIIYI